MEEYKGNSNASKVKKPEQAPPKKDKVISGKATIRQPSKVEKFAKTFIKEDAHSISSYIWGDIIVPKIKDMLAISLKDSVDMLFYGAVNQSRDRFANGRTVTKYNKISTKNYQYTDRPAQQTARRATSNYENIVVETRGEAEKVLDTLYAILDQYKVVRVSELFEIVELSCEYTDQKYGWTSLAGSEIVRIGNGFGFRLPIPRPID